MADVFPSIQTLERQLSLLFTSQDLVVSRDKEVASLTTSSDKGGADLELKRAFQALLGTATNKDKEEIVVVVPPVEAEGESDSASPADDEEELSVEIPDAPPAPPVQLSRMVLPPRPSEIKCDCHNAVECPGTNGFSSFCCSICMEMFTPGEVRTKHSANCHTYTCDACLQDQISFRVRQGDVKKLYCPSCGFVLLTQEVTRILSAEDVEKYHRFLLLRLLDAMPGVTRCGNPGCENAVIMPSCDNNVPWECEQCSVKCPYCKEDKATHGRMMCAAERKFRRDAARQNVWVALSRSKRCPECRTPIIKNGGCKHMTCRNPDCGHEFCWHCKRPWRSHNMCVFEGIALAGAILLSPAIVAVGVGLVAAVALPLSAANAMTGNTMFKGKSVMRMTWKLGKKLYNKVF